MKIHTYWWGAEMFPDSDAEWESMKQLFTNPTVLGTYEGSPEGTAEVWDGNVDPGYKDAGHGAYDSRPYALQQGITTETRCVTISR